ncbi:MAG: Scaffold-type E3 ligase [Pycnora praestabilis]|nr:MAG: Scaffold-type E3 ligase [Pycnora praestabilis]
MPPAYSAAQKKAIADFVSFTSTKDSVAARPFLGYHKGLIMADSTPPSSQNRGRRLSPTPPAQHLARVRREPRMFRARRNEKADIPNDEERHNQALVAHSDVMKFSSPPKPKIDTVPNEVLARAYTEFFSNRRLTKKLFTISLLENVRGGLNPWAARPMYNFTFGRLNMSDEALNHMLLLHGIQPGPALDPSFRCNPSEVARVRAILGLPDLGEEENHVNFKRDTVQESAVFRDHDTGEGTAVQEPAITKDRSKGKDREVDNRMGRSEIEKGNIKRMIREISIHLEAGHIDAQHAQEGIDTLISSLSSNPTEADKGAMLSEYGIAAYTIFDQAESSQVTRDAEPATIRPLIFKNSYDPSDKTGEGPSKRIIYKEIHSDDDANAIFQSSNREILTFESENEEEGKSDNKLGSPDSADSDEITTQTLRSTYNNFTLGNICAENARRNFAEALPGLPEELLKKELRIRGIETNNIFATDGVGNYCPPDSQNLKISGLDHGDIEQDLLNSIASRSVRAIYERFRTLQIDATQARNEFRDTFPNPNIRLSEHQLKNRLEAYGIPIAQLFPPDSSDAVKEREEFLKQKLLKVFENIQQGQIDFEDALWAFRRALGNLDMADSALLHILACSGIPTSMFFDDKDFINAAQQHIEAPSAPSRPEQAEVKRETFADELGDIINWPNTDILEAAATVEKLHIEKWSLGEAPVPYQFRFENSQEDMLHITDQDSVRTPISHAKTEFSHLVHKSPNLTKSGPSLPLFDECKAKSGLSSTMPMDTDDGGQAITLSSGSKVEGETIITLTESDMQEDIDMEASVEELPMSDKSAAATPTALSVGHHKPGRPLVAKVRGQQSVPEDTLRRGNLSRLDTPMPFLGGAQPSDFTVSKSSNANPSVAILAGSLQNDTQLLRVGGEHPGAGPHHKSKIDDKRSNEDIDSSSGSVLASKDHNPSEKASAKPVESIQPEEEFSPVYDHDPRTAGTPLYDQRSVSSKTYLYWVRHKEPRNQYSQRDVEKIHDLLRKPKRTEAHPTYEVQQDRQRRPSDSYLWGLPGSLAEAKEIAVHLGIHPDEMIKRFGMAPPGPIGTRQISQSRMRNRKRKLSAISSNTGSLSRRGTTRNTRRIKKRRTEQVRPRNPPILYMDIAKRRNAEPQLIDIFELWLHGGGKMTAENVKRAKRYCGDEHMSNSALFAWGMYMPPEDLYALSRQVSRQRSDGTLAANRIARTKSTNDDEWSDVSDDGQFQPVEFPASPPPPVEQALDFVDAFIDSPPTNPLSPTNLDLESMNGSEIPLELIPAKTRKPLSCGSSSPSLDSPTKDLATSYGVYGDYLMQAMEAAVAQGLSLTEYLPVMEQVRIETDELLHYRYFQNPNGPSPGLSNTAMDFLNKMFDGYRDAPIENPDVIGVDGSMKYLRDLDVSLDEVIVLAVSEALSSPTMGEFTRTGFLDGWKALGLADTLDKQQNCVHHMRLKLTTSPDLFKRVYRHTLILARTPPQRALPLDVAIEYWRLLFTEPSVSWYTQTTPWLDWWIEYLEGSWKMGVNKDMWDMTYEFYIKSMADESMSWWDENGAWPGVLDEFVAFVKGKRMVGESMDLE